MRLAALFAAVAILAGAWATDSHSFALHMTVHMAVVAIAAPLLAYAIARPLNFSPVLASLIELVAVWVWHMPLLHNTARHHTLTYLAEQATFLLAGLLLWIAVLSRRAEGVIALLLTAMHMTLLGALLAMSPRPLYQHGDLDDQHWGGAIMLLIGGAAYLAGGLALSHGLLNAMCKESRLSTARPSR